MGRRGVWAHLWRRTLRVLVCLLIVGLVSSDGYLGEARQDFLAQEAIGSHDFRFVAWEMQALGQKISDFVTHPGDSLPATQQHDLVLTYLDTVGKTDRLQAQIERIHADPKETDRAAASAPLQAELDRLRSEQAARRPIVERILQRQVATVLAADGLTTRNMILPPLLFQFTESPDVLIVSPRDHIVVAQDIMVDPGLPMTTMEQIEGQVEQQVDVSALVEGTGGLAAYPTMVVAVDDLSWILSTVAHEWTHTYLAFRPLGFNYFENGDTRTLNETVASMVGDEVGQQVLERFYPDQVPPPSKPEGSASRTAEQPAQPKFDFGATMRTTRLHVDALLAEGKVQEAESYMEAQRQVLAENGYYIRKLNQAYFAFHGSYAVGAAATDPIGDKLRTLRQRSADLAAFVHTVSGITSVRELDALLATK